MAKARTRKSAQDRKHEIVETTIRLSGELGPNRVTTQRVADAVGLTQPAIFRHFPTKSDLWDAVGDQVEVLIRPLAIEIAPDDARLDDPAQMLHEALRSQLEFMVDHPAICTILTSRELHATHEGMRLRIARLMMGRRRELAALVEHGLAKGQYRKGLSPDDTALLILATIQGLSAQWSLENRAFDLAEVGERLLSGVLKSFLN
ncbi:MAG: TetR/AcrR family transcriptional regulator [Maritimibacter sp.]